MVAPMLLIALSACAGGGATGTSPSTDAPAPAPTPPAPGADPVADVTAVRTTGDSGAYTFFVTVRSDETGCERYADWWEVVTPDEQLVYRRILTHSHPTEQPFERSGGPVDVAADEEVLVRAHLAPGGYLGQVMRGTAADGFTPATDLPADFAADLEDEAPQPESCLF